MGPRKQKKSLSWGFRSVIAKQSMSLVLNKCLDVRSALLYGQFSADKMLTLQVGATVSGKMKNT